MWAKRMRFKLFLVTLLVNILVFASVDVFVLHDVFKVGYKRDDDFNKALRSPDPYVGFVGAKNELDHNEFGFRGKSFRDAPEGALKIAFFGGSTGYNGEPTIAQSLEDNLKRILKKDVFVANFSVVSSHHRQHLHSIIEHAASFKPDAIVFYGGWNELHQAFNYDPRPLLPYNWFVKGETSLIGQLLISYSGIIGELDKYTGFITSHKQLKEKYKPGSASWNASTIEKYFSTLDLSEAVSNAIGAKFFAFYQPYQMPEYFSASYENLLKVGESKNYFINAHDFYDELSQKIFLDSAHVVQKARNHMGLMMANVLVTKL